MTDLSARPSNGRGGLVAIGFGTTVAMWAVGYVCRFPPAVVPNWLLLLLLLGCLLAGGMAAGRYLAHGWRGGLYVGLLTSLLNLLVLGSLLTGEQPNRVVPSALWWLPGSFLVGAVLGAIGAAVGGAVPARDAAVTNWTTVFARVLAAATFLLLIIGGLVTGAEAGLAVVDWPNSFGYNMFLYPLSRMTGGVYYEHAHRLFGSLVGLTTLVLAVQLHRTGGPRWLRRMGWFALLAVIVQGSLGGLRVTGRFTLSTSPADTAPSIVLAMVHGTLGQVFFALVVALAVFTSTPWRRPPVPTCRPSAGTDRTLSAVVVALVIVQLVLGTVLRHIAGGLHIHIALAVVVLLAAINSGLRAWGLYADQPQVRRLGRRLAIFAGLQVGFGIAAYVAVGATAGVHPRPWADVLVTTAHQAMGALVLAAAVALMLWNYRVLSPQPAGELTPHAS